MGLCLMAGKGSQQCPGRPTFDNWDGQSRAARAFLTDSWDDMDPMAMLSQSARCQVRHSCLNSLTHPQGMYPHPHLLLKVGA